MSSFSAVPWQDPLLQYGVILMVAHAMCLRSVLPQCQEKIRASTTNTTPRERTRGGGRQVYFPSNAFANSVAVIDMATCCCCFLVVLFCGVTVPRLRKPRRRSLEDCATYQAKSTTHALHHVWCFSAFPFFLEPPIL